MSESAYEKAKRLADKHSGAGSFLKLENDQDSAVVVFCGDPDAREVVWVESQQQYRDATPEDTSDLVFRFKINVYTVSFTSGGKTTPVKKMQIFEQGVKVFRQFLALKEKYGLEKRAYEIKRHGAKGNTKTTYTIFPEEVKFTDAEWKEIADTKLLDLDKTRDGESESSSSAESNDGKISQQIASQIKQTVVALKPEGQQKFVAYLKSINAEKISLISSEKEKEALDTAMALAREEAGGATTAEADPFG